ncbi:LysR family transcriptional regulator [Paracoccus sp. Z118]|uniref:LysR family transcriptional regulator n=1 Tax=Paracoccus sp. Z118 TaxID=2851017 RepID=UPI001C2BA8C1|nr:LysR family transcriptional regulator [Paracoccus sp. Z118]MBV0893399.1 LysR family transcriptional regulator [Paracoccus sp. Z118]
MQLDDVNVFLQIAASGSLSAASRDLARPKATVSHQLRRLEEEIGASLFIRSANRLVLSEAGEEFRDHARNIRRACERGLDAARRSQNVAVGKVRIGSGGEFTSNVIAPLVLHFARLHPQLRLEVMVLRGDALLSARDSLDCILFLGEPPMPQVADLTARLLSRFPFGLYASPRYLAAHGQPASPRDLRAHDLIGFHNGETLTLWELENGKQDYSIHPNAHFLTNDYWAAKLAAIHDHGICFIPHFFAGAEVEDGLLEPVLPEWQSREIPMYALFSSHRLNNPNTRLLIDALSKNFSDIFSYLYTATRKDSLSRR